MKAILTTALLGGAAIALSAFAATNEDDADAATKIEQYKAVCEAQYSSMVNCGCMVEQLEEDNTLIEPVLEITDETTFGTAAPEAQMAVMACLG